MIIILLFPGILFFHTKKMSTDDFDEILAALFEGVVKIPTPADAVFKEECAFSCATAFTPGGIFTSLLTHKSFARPFILSQDLEIFLHQQSKKIKNETPAENLMIPVEWETETVYHLAAARGGKLLHAMLPYPVSHEYSEIVPESILKAAEAVIKNAGEEMREAARAWEAMEDPRPVSRYAENLEISNLRDIKEALAAGRCEKTGETSDNLWLNLSDGFIGGGRKNWDGSGGTNGAIDHYKEMLALGKNFPLAVKLGTITSSGDAEVYSYAVDEDGLVKDPFLRDHLQRWGVEIVNQTKTAKTVAEMEVELNKEFAWERITEAGKDLEIVSGPGLVGLRNLGNTCYLNSFLQIFAKIGEIQNQFSDFSGNFRKSCWEKKDFKNLEISKIVNALTSGEFADNPPIAPTSFRAFFCKGHLEFSSHRQQDVVEFLQFFVEKFPGSLFNFQVAEKLECQGKQKIERRNENVLSLQVPFDQHSKIDSSDPPEVSFESCLAKTFATEIIEGFKYKGIVTPAEKTLRLLTYPPFLWVAVRRYFIDETWQPKKLDVAVSMPLEMDLETFRGSLEVTEMFDDDLEISELVNLGFSREAAVRALKVVDGVEAAAEWLFSHPEQVEKFPGEESLPLLTSLGFDERQARAAIKAAKGDAEKAADWLFANSEDLDTAVCQVEETAEKETAEKETAFEMRDGKGQYELTAFISHIGKSVGTGHYVAHAKHGNNWVIFNDEKVAKSESPPFAFGYLYLYKRKD